MPTSVFELVSERLEATTDLATLEARGTLRLALTHAGLDATGVTPAQMCVVLDQVLPGELRARGVADPEQVCAALVASLQSEGSAGDQRDPESPEEVFRRLARG